MPTSIELYSKINDYIEKRITLHDLESWLVPILPYYLSDPGTAVYELVGIIELGLAEIQAGIRSERTFRKFLYQHTPPNKIMTATYPKEVGTTQSTAVFSTIETSSWDWASQSPSWSTIPQVEYVK